MIFYHWCWCVDSCLGCYLDSRESRPYLLTCGLRPVVECCLSIRILAWCSVIAVCGVGLLHPHWQGSADDRLAAYLHWLLQVAALWCHGEFISQLSFVYNVCWMSLRTLVSNVTVKFPPANCGRRSLLHSNVGSRVLYYSLMECFVKWNFHCKN